MKVFRVVGIMGGSPDQGCRCPEKMILSCRAWREHGQTVRIKCNPHSPNKIHQRGCGGRLREEVRNRRRRIIQAMAAVLEDLERGKKHGDEAASDCDWAVAVRTDHRCRE